MNAGSLIIIVAMFALLWLLLIRPQRAAAVKRQALIESVDIGDEILTAGGMYATVTGVGDDTDELFVEIADGIEVRVDRRSIGSIVRKDEDEPEEGDDVDELDTAPAPDDEPVPEPVVADERAGSAEPDRR